MSKLRLLMHLVDRTNEWVGKIASLWMIPMIFIMLFEVGMRYAVKAPTVWGTELVTLMFAAYILLGGGYALRYGDHVNMNAFYSRLTFRKKAILDIITFVALFLYCGSLLKEGGRFAWEAIEMGRHTGTDWNPPLYPALLTLPIAAFLMLLQGLVKFIRDLITAITGKETQA